MAETDSSWDSKWKGWEKPAWPEYTILRINWFRRTCEELKESGKLDNPSIVEVGAGSGWVTRELCKLFPDSPYVCADVSSVALQKLRSLNLPNVKTCLMDKLMELGQRADLVVCGDVYEHVKDRPLFFDYVRNVLNPGGRLLVSTPNRFMPILYLRRMFGKEATGQPYDRPVDKWQLQRDLREQGFEVVECHMERASRRAGMGRMSLPKRLVFKFMLRVLAACFWIAHRPMGDAIMIHARYPQQL